MREKILRKTEEKFHCFFFDNLALIINQLKKEFFGLFILLALCSNSFSQNFSYPFITATGKRLSDFVPAGWSIRDSAKGDLNRDITDDVAMVLEYKDSVSIEKQQDGIIDSVKTIPRILVILFYSRDNKNYYLREQSNTFILNHDDPMMDDPYVSIKIEHELLIVDFQLFYAMGSWEVNNATYKFKYQDKNFVLIGAEYRSYHRVTRDFLEYSYNFLTRQRIFVSGNVNIASRNEERKRINTPLQNLKTFPKPFTWKIEKGVYL